MSLCMSDFTATHANTDDRTVQNISQPLFMIDDVSEHISESMHMSGGVCQDSLSIHVPCLLPHRLSGWGSLEEKYFWRSQNTQHGRGSTVVEQFVLRRAKKETLTCSHLCNA